MLNWSRQNEKQLIEEGHVHLNPNKLSRTDQWTPRFPSFEQSSLLGIRKLGMDQFDRCIKSWRSRTHLESQRGTE